MKKLLRISVFILPIVFMFISPLWSGTTGKIAGIIIDKETGEALPGANVIVIGTSLGAASDMEGQYTILYVPPGMYDVQVSFIGYAKVTIKDVRVNIDQTARINFTLESEAIELEAVTIVAERTLIKEDVATSVVAISDREVRELPVTNVDDVISLQAGIKDNFEIRGGTKEDILFMVDGIAMRDPRNNEPMTKIALSSVKEISVERGGFTAEYGQIQSGLVNIVTKEGGKSGYYGSFTTRISPPAPKYYRGGSIPDVHDPDSYWMRPYLDDAVCWTGTTIGEPYQDIDGNSRWDKGELYEDLNGDGSRTYWDQYTRDQYLSFGGWNEVSRQLMTDNDPNNDLTPLACQRVFMYETRKRQRNELADYEIDAGFGGPVPLISKPLGGLRFFTSYRRTRDVLLWPQANPDYVDYDWSMQLTSDITNSMKLRISGLMGNVSTLAENWNYNNYPHWPYEIAGGTGGRTLFNMFSDWAWCVSNLKHRSLAAKLTHSVNAKTFYEVSLEYFQRDYNTGPIARRNTSKTTEILPGYFVDEYPFGYYPEGTPGVTPDIADGIQASLARDASVVSSTTLKADVTSQVDFNNLVKAGIEFVYNDLDMDYGFIRMQTGGETYGQHVQMYNFPVRAAAYIQDKLETKGFTMNAGARFDYSNSKTDWWDVNSYDRSFISSSYNPEREFPMKKSKAQWQISPRLGISHPITEKSKLFFNYGHFKQMPQYETLFRIRRSETGVLQSLGDPNLILAKTVSYELGFDYLLMNDFLFQLAAFYRDITNQQDTIQYNATSGDSYYLATNNKYRDVRGFELTIRKTAGRWVSGFANYTYQAITYGEFGKSRMYEDPSKQRKEDANTVALYQARPIPTPFARTNINFHTPDNFGTALLGQNILGSLMVNFILEWERGKWETYNPQKASGIIYNVQYRDELKSTLRFSKTFYINKFSVQFLVDINNLFNRLNLRDANVRNPKYMQSLHLPESDAYDNIPGNDKVGDYREPGVEWQPMKYQEEIITQEEVDLAAAQDVEIVKSPAPYDRAIYYEGSTGKWFEIIETEDGLLDWKEVDSAKKVKIKEDKAYIYNPNPSTFSFLDPRRIFFGLRISFDLN
jgi:outer membrane receptor protein involved in Fe transport